MEAERCLDSAEWHSKPVILTVELSLKETNIAATDAVTGVYIDELSTAEPNMSLNLGSHVSDAYVAHCVSAVVDNCGHAQLAISLRAYLCNTGLNNPI